LLVVSSLLASSAHAARAGGDDSLCREKYAVPNAVISSSTTILGNGDEIILCRFVRPDGFDGARQYGWKADSSGGGRRVPLPITRKLGILYATKGEDSFGVESLAAALLVAQAPAFGQGSAYFESIKPIKVLNKTPKSTWWALWRTIQKRGGWDRQITVYRSDSSGKHPMASFLGYDRRAGGDKETRRYEFSASDEGLSIRENVLGSEELNPSAEFRASTVIAYRLDDGGLVALSTRTYQDIASSDGKDNPPVVRLKGKICRDRKLTDCRDGRRETATLMSAGSTSGSSLPTNFLEVALSSSDSHLYISKTDIDPESLPEIAR
jgi:hypothetical protein